MTAFRCSVYARTKTKNCISNCTEVRSKERWVLYPATKRQIEQIVSKSKTPAEVFQDSRVVYMYTIGLDTGRGTLRKLTVDELSDADRLPEGAYV